MCGSGNPQIADGSVNECSDFEKELGFSVKVKNVCTL